MIYWLLDKLKKTYCCADFCNQERGSPAYSIKLDRIGRERAFYFEFLALFIRLPYARKAQLSAVVMMCDRRCVMFCTV
jgi:hypothetical protein